MVVVAGSSSCGSVAWNSVRGLNDFQSLLVIAPLTACAVASVLSRLASPPSNVLPGSGAQFSNPTSPTHAPANALDAKQRTSAHVTHEIETAMRDQGLMSGKYLRVIRHEGG